MVKNGDLLVAYRKKLSKIGTNNSVVICHIRMRKVGYNEKRSDFMSKISIRFLVTEKCGLFGMMSKISGGFSTGHCGRVAQ